MEGNIRSKDKEIERRGERRERGQERLGKSRRWTEVGKERRSRERKWDREGNVFEERESSMLECNIRVYKLHIYFGSFRLLPVNDSHSDLCQGVLKPRLNRPFPSFCDTLLRCLKADTTCSVQRKHRALQSATVDSCTWYAYWSSLFQLIVNKTQRRLNTHSSKVISTVLNSERK